MTYLSRDAQAIKGEKQDGSNQEQGNAMS